MAAELTREDGEGIVFGLHPVLALLAEGRVESLWLIQPDSPRIQEIARLARERGCKFKIVERGVLDRLCHGGVHQGVAARAVARPQPDWDTLLQRLQADIQDHPLLVLLDGVEDARNLGAVVRSAEAFGATAVILPKDRSAPLSAVAIKAAAGAAEWLDVVRVTNLARTIVALQQIGFTVYGLCGDGDHPLDELTFSGPIALVLGGEGRGMRRLVREKCDTLVGIPMAGRAQSLNLAVAAGIALYAATRRA